MNYADLALSQMLLMEAEVDEEEEHLEACALAALGLISHGEEEMRRIRNERRRDRRLYLTRTDLLPNPRTATPWQALYESRNDRAFITTMGFSVTAFHNILHHGFENDWNTIPIPRNDVPATSVPRPARRSLDAAGALGLVLHFLNSTMHDVSLMQIFALIPSTVSRYVSFSFTILLSSLRQMRNAQIRWLSGDEFEANNALIVVRHPLLTGAFGSMDGLNLMVQTSSDEEIENATFNGWLHEHFVSNVLVFGATG